MVGFLLSRPLYIFPFLLAPCLTSVLVGAFVAPRLFTIQESGVTTMGLAKNFGEAHQTSNDKQGQQHIVRRLQHSN